MPHQGDEQESPDCFLAELDCIQPSAAGPKHNPQLTQANEALAVMFAKQVARKDHARHVSDQFEANRAFRKYQAKFGWTEAQFAEFWPLRSLPKGFGERQTEWERLLDRERKRVKAEDTPRKTTRVKDMAEDDAKAHRLKQVREAVARHRATKARLSGEVELTEDELRKIEDAEAEEELRRIADAEAGTTASTDDNELSRLLASLQEAEDAERAADEQGA